MTTKIRFFRDDIASPDHFTVTLELVPGPATRGPGVETVMNLARDAYADGRISAVTITDNPGGNPNLSPDALAYRIFRIGLDVIVHFTCRDTNRVGMESRALQLDLVGIKNILALTGDYTGAGFGGQGAPVFDLDSVNLICMLSMLSDRLEMAGDPERFLVGCAVSPFKKTEGETFAQYAKLCKKVSAGVGFIVTQLGYDSRKFEELMRVKTHMGIDAPVLASLYHLTPHVARIMAEGRVPGAVVTPKLLDRVMKEWQDPAAGRTAAIERTARLGAVIKGLGYRGIHLGGVHKSFKTIAAILNRMDDIASEWESFVPEFGFPQPAGFYYYRWSERNDLPCETPKRHKKGTAAHMGWGYQINRGLHHFFFSFDSPVAPFFAWLAKIIDRHPFSRISFTWIEKVMKQMLFECRSCGDCGLPHAAFLCPESQCPKHIRNGPCGGSREGRCEVRQEKLCVWQRVYKRLAAVSNPAEMAAGCVPPRMWELDGTSSWLNFHLRRDHQSASTDIKRLCLAPTCTPPPDPKLEPTSRSYYDPHRHTP